MLHRLGIELPTAKYDSMLAKYLISTTEDNKVETIGRLFANKYISTDEEVYGKGAKRRIPEDEIYSNIWQENPCLGHNESSNDPKSRGKWTISSSDGNGITLANVLAKWK